jgi:RimJ/RimL family protein N-acetyltransferase
MEPFPTLRTERLVLREFALGDAPELYRIARAREVARTMLRHPHPYEEGEAERWISGLRPMFEAGIGTTLAVVLREGGTLVGTDSLYTRAKDGTAVLGEDGTGLLGFWIGVAYWKQGLRHRGGLGGGALRLRGARLAAHQGKPLREQRGVGEGAA